jgi:outer membrane lipoprotein-sorting protein
MINSGHTMKLTLTTVLILFLSGFLGVYAQDAESLLSKMDNIMFPSVDKQGKIEIILTDKNGKEKLREAEFSQSPDGKKLYKYTKPESQAGIATLAFPDGVMWMYMPAFGKPKKITMLAKSQAFTGTDFAYEDMAMQSYSERYTPSLIETNGGIYHMLELIPKSDKSNYSRIVISLDKANFYPIKMEYYDKAKNKRKEANYKYQKVGEYWNAERVVMTDLKKQHSTTINLSEVKFDQQIPDEVFLVENLKPLDQETKE